MNLKTFVILFLLGTLVSCSSNRDKITTEENNHRVNEANAFR